MTNPRRRDLAWLALVLPKAAPAAERVKLPSKTYKFEDLPAKANGGRDVFDGLTHSGYQVDLHETELAPGLAPHAPHRHAHEEIVMVREGLLEITIEGRLTSATPGSVVYVASNEFHGWKNAGSTQARYFVVALGREK